MANADEKRIYKSGEFRRCSGVAAKKINGLDAKIANRKFRAFGSALEVAVEEYLMRGLNV